MKTVNPIKDFKSFVRQIIEVKKLISKLEKEVKNKRKEKKKTIPTIVSKSKYKFNK